MIIYFIAYILSTMNLIIYFSEIKIRQPPTTEQDIIQGVHAKKNSETDKLKH